MLSLAQRGWGAKLPPNPAYPLDGRHTLAQGMTHCLLAHPGRVLLDRSSQANHGVLTGGAKWLPGVVDFDGSTGYVDCGTNTPRPALTVHARVNVKTVISATNNQIVSKGFDGSNTEWQLCIDSNGHYAFSSFNGTVNFGAISSVSAAPGWQDVTGSFDGSTWRVYVNGILLLAAAGATPVTTTRKVLVGAVDTSIVGVTQWFNGQVERVYIYGRALTDAEVMDLTNAPYEMFAAPSVQWAPGAGGAGMTFVECHNTIISDRWSAVAY